MISQWSLYRETGRLAIFFLMFLKLFHDDSVSISVQSTKIIYNLITAFFPSYFYIITKELLQNGKLLTPFSYCLNNSSSFHYFYYINNCIIKFSTQAPIEMWRASIPKKHSLIKMHCFIGNTKAHCEQNNVQP